jgi:hypothetical protein
MTAVGPVVYNVFVNDVAVMLPLFVLDVELVETWGCHDVMVLRVEYNRAFKMQSIKPWPDNARIMVAWGRKPQALNLWYGYVNHHKLSGISDSGTHNLQYTYYCIGTSKPMNSVENQYWGSVTPTYIAKQIAQQHHLRAVVTSTTWVLQSEVQANESDFQFMNRIANKTGYRFWVSGGTLYFIDPSVVIVGAGQTTVPTYRMDKRLDWQDTMRDFEKLQGDNLPGAPVATRSVWGVDINSGQVFQAKAGSGSIKQNSTARVATNLGDGQRHVNAWQDLSQWWVAATAEVFGNVTIYPGKVIGIQGNAVPSGDQGLWIVSSAKHLMKASGVGNIAPTHDKYVTQVSLTRNSSGPAPTIKGASRISPEFVECVASGGVWQSTSIGVIMDGSDQ